MNRWTGFDDKILSLYARGMTVREIQSHLEEMYGTEIFPTRISSLTDAVMEDAKAWQSRPLGALYPIVYLDCIHVKTRDNGAVRAKAVYLALGINLAGEKELLSLWIAQTEGAKFWLQVVTGHSWHRCSNHSLNRATGKVCHGTTFLTKCTA